MQWGMPSDSRSLPLRQADEVTAPSGRHPLDCMVHDPSPLTPLCDESEFVTLMSELVGDEAPHSFAVDTGLTLTRSVSVESGRPRRTCPLTTGLSFRESRQE